MAEKTDDELQVYIDNLREHGIRSKAARAAGMQLRTVLKYIETDPEFAEEEALAFQEAADYLEEEARRRAVEGVVTRREYNDAGDLIKETHTYSDSLLSKLLDGALPDKYAQRTKSELSGPDGQPIGLDTKDTTSIAARLSSLLALAKERKEAAESVGDLLE